MWFGGGPRTDEKVYCLLSKTILSPVVFSELLCLYGHSASNRKYSCLCRGLSHPRLLLQHDVSNSELFSAFISISKLTCPASHSQGVCLILASCTNPSLVASAQRSGREGPAGLGPAAVLAVAGAVPCSRVAYAVHEVDLFFQESDTWGPVLVLHLTWYGFGVVLSGPLSPRLSAALRDFQVCYAPRF